MTRGLELLTIIGRAAVLPHNSVVDRLSSITIPDHCSFALIGDPNRGYFGALLGRSLHNLLAHSQSILPNTGSLLLNPAIVGVKQL